MLISPEFFGGLVIGFLGTVAAELFIFLLALLGGMFD
jgi:hypothetical protein